jgi:hypothetical protein
MKSYCIISFSILASFSVLAMDTSAPAQPTDPIVIVGAIERNNDKVGSPILGRATRLRYSRDVLESLAVPQTDKEKQQSEKFVKGISDKIAELTTAVEAAKTLKAEREAQAKGRKNLTQSTP